MAEESLDPSIQELPTPDAPQDAPAAAPVEDAPAAPEATPAPDNAQGEASAHVADAAALQVQLDAALSELYQTRVYLHNARQAVEDEKETNRRLTAKVAVFERVGPALQAALDALNQ